MTKLYYKAQMNLSQLTYRRDIRFYWGREYSAPQSVALFTTIAHYQLTVTSRPRNDLYCVERNVKPYSLTHSLTAWSKDCTKLLLGTS